MSINYGNLKGWCGYVAPNGRFFKVGRRKEYQTSDDEYILLFAKDVLWDMVREELRKKKIKNFCYRDVMGLLLNELGYVYFEVDYDSLNIIYPNYVDVDMDITSEQIEMLMRLCDVNEMQVSEHFCRVRD